MPIFSNKSLKNLSESHQDLWKLFTEIIKSVDCTVTCGYRGEEDQEKAFQDGFSKAHFGESPHNYRPCFAVDVIPTKTKWNDIQKLKELAAFVKITAIDMGIDIEWGGDWKFVDLPHYELKNWRNMIK
jgi:hypothetical protein